MGTYFLRFFTLNKRSFLLFFVLAFNINTLCLAEVYKYKDEQGNWHYGDKPPSEGQETKTIKGVTKQKPTSSNLKDELYGEFRTETPIEKAALAVVTIKTPLVIGSGFFISENGYILTNKHVVRPSEMTGMQELKNNVKEMEKVYREADKELKSREAELRKMIHKLDAYKKDIDKETNSTRKEYMHTEYEIYNDQYKAWLKEIKKVRRSVRAEKREFDKAKRAFSRGQSAAMDKNSFDIIIKGDKHLNARLISISTKYDLALLKVDRYETPSIDFAEVQSVSQGSTVYAIGSPLGVRNAITSGVVMKIKDDYIMTDTKILPGNSGGPLINESGQAIGINTIQIIELVTIASESFGIAISINAASKEFKKILSN